MSRPTSFRLPEDLLTRLDDEASATGVSVTGLVASMLDEGLKTRRFPGVVYRDGPSGRRAALVGGPDVWEIIRVVRQATGRGERRVVGLAAELGVPVARIRLAIDFYAAFPAEIDERIAIDERSAARLRDLIARRQHLMTS